MVATCERFTVSNNLWHRKKGNIARKDVIRIERVRELPKTSTGKIQRFKLRGR